MNKLFCEIVHRLKKDKKLMLISAMGAVGLLLLLVSEIIPDSAVTPAIPVQTDIYALQEKTAQDVEALLRTVEGVGRVRVLVSIESLEEKIVARDKESSSGDGKNETKENYVLVKDGGDTKGLTLKILTPVIRGVAVSCEGGASNIVRSEVTKLVSAGLGISSNKIWVSKMEK